MTTETIEKPQIAPSVAMPAHPPRRRVVWRRIGAVAAILLALFVATAALLPSSFWRWLIIHEVSSATGRRVNIDGPVAVHLFTLHPQLSVEGLSIGNANWAGAQDMLNVKKFEATLSLKALLGFHLMFPRVVIDTPVINVERDASGRANWESQRTASAPPDAPATAPLHMPAIQELELTNGSLNAVDRVRKLTFNGHISVQETQNVADNHALKLRGSGKLNGKPFQLILDGEPLIGVKPSKPYGFATTVTAADIKLSARASIKHPFDLAALQAEFHLSGSDLADVYYLTGLAMPNTAPYDVSGTLVRDNLQFKVDDFRGKLGSSDVSGKLAVDARQKRPKLTAVLLAKQLNLKDMAAPLGTEATPTAKSNTLARPTPPAGATAAAGPEGAGEQPATTLLLPDADLQVQRVRGMDADVQFEAAAVTAEKLPLQKVRFHLTVNDGKIALNPLAFALPQGEFSGTVTIDAQGAVPLTSIDMKLTHVDLAQFKPKSAQGAPFEGQLLGRVKLQGSGSSVHKAAANAAGDITLVVPQGEMREALAELTGIDVSRGLGLILTNNQRNTQVRCGVANFKAEGGDLRASTFVIDTTNVLVTGQGHINLNSEALDLSLQGNPKKVRVFRLRAPILLHGTLSQPKIGVHPGKLAAQTGGALALGALLTPLAAVLAFVDGGLAKDANCAALIGQAEEGKSVPQE